MKIVKLITVVGLTIFSLVSTMPLRHRVSAMPKPEDLSISPAINTSAQTEEIPADESNNAKNSSDYAKEIEDGYLEPFTEWPRWTCHEVKPLHTTILCRKFQVDAAWHDFCPELEDLRRIYCIPGQKLEGICNKFAKIAPTHVGFCGSKNPYYELMCSLNFMNEHYCLEKGNEFVLAYEPVCISLSGAKLKKRCAQATPEDYGPVCKEIKSMQTKYCKRKHRLEALCSELQRNIKPKEIYEGFCNRDERNAMICWMEDIYEDFCVPDFNEEEILKNQRN